LETLGIIGALVCDLSDDPIERIRLLKATVWVLVGRLLSAWGQEERDEEWAEARAAVMDVASQVRGQREGRVQ